MNQINFIRHKPSAYIPYLNQYIKEFDDGCLNIQGIEFGIELEEGLSVLKEALTYLKNCKGDLKPLLFNNYLRKAAQDHFNDIAPKGLTTHFSSDKKTTYKERIEKHCRWGGSIFEAILYGFERPSAKDVVLAMIIDDGFKNRPHRNNLMNPDHREFAIVHGSHMTANFCYIALYAA